MSEEVMDSGVESEAATSGSLLSVDTKTEEQAPDEGMPHLAETTEKPVESDFEWGEKPEWMPEQFWNNEEGPDLEGIAQAYQELRTKMSQGRHKAPKDGKYDMKQLQDHGIPGDDPLLSDFSKFAAENGLSQDDFDAITQMYMQHVGELYENVEVDVQREMDKLGRNGGKIIESTSQWLTKLGSSGVLSAEEVDAIAGAAQTAEFVRALNKIRDSYGERTIPSIDVQEGVAMTKADLEAMVADERYGKDMRYTQDVERKFMEFFGEA